jgi:hypothetical protein
MRRLKEDSGAILMRATTATAFCVAVRLAGCFADVRGGLGRQRRGLSTINLVCEIK